MRQSIFNPPSVTSFVECPNCKQLMRYGLERCTRCREEVSAEYALLSAQIVQHNTQAVSVANTIKTSEPGVLIVFFSTLIGYFIAVPLLLIVNLCSPVMILLGILFWFYRYGRFAVGDEDYLRSSKDMMVSLKLWLALIGLQTIVILYLIYR